MQVAHLVVEVQEEAPLHLVVMVVQELKPLVAVVVTVVITKTKHMVVVEAMVETHRVVQMRVLMQKIVVEVLVKMVLQ